MASTLDSNHDANYYEESASEHVSAANRAKRPDWRDYYEEWASWYVTLANEELWASR